VAIALTAYEAASSRVDEKAKTSYIHAAFADALAIYLLSLTLDFDYVDLREREYPAAGFAGAGGTAARGSHAFSAERGISVPSALPPKVVPGRAGGALWPRLLWASSDTNLTDQEVRFAVLANR